MVPAPTTRLVRRPRTLRIRFVYTTTLSIFVTVQSAGNAQEAMWSLREELRIGSIDGPTALSEVNGVQVGLDGSIYVLQPLDAVIRVFSSDGSPLKDLGRRGEGPGEFEAPAFMAWREDTLWVLDRRLNRVTLWSEDRFAGGFPLPSPKDSAYYTNGWPVPQALLPGRQLLYILHPRRPRSSDDPEAVVLRMGPAGRRVVELARGPHRPPPVLDFGQAGRVLLLFQPFDDGSLIAFSPKGTGFVVVDRPVAANADTAHFNVTYLDADGDTVFSSALPYSPIPVTGDLTDQLLGERTQLLRSRVGSRAGALNALREAVYLPPFHPPATKAIVGRDGSVWIRREDTREGRVKWLVLAGTGQVIGQFWLERSLDVVQAQRGYVWAVDHDEFDIPYVVRLRIDERAAHR